MIWKKAILAGALAASLSLSLVSKASADPWWKDHHRGRHHEHHGNGWYRHHDRGWYRHDRDWRDDRRARWDGWRARHRDRDWSRRDRWFDDHRADRGWWHDHPSASSRDYPRRWAYR